MSANKCKKIGILQASTNQNNDYKKTDHHQIQSMNRQTVKKVQPSNSMTYKKALKTSFYGSQVNFKEFSTKI